MEKFNNEKFNSKLWEKTLVMENFNAAAYEYLLFLKF
jgi:hypothetical protein